MTMDYSPCSEHAPLMYLLYLFLCRLEKEVASEVVHEAVQTQRESETERQEITKNFMKMRENRLKQQMLLEKNHLSTQMIQVHHYNLIVICYN